MASIKFSRKELEKHIKINSEILEKISQFGTPIESINDEELEIEIFPNRPDLLSLQGFLRSLKAFLNLSPGLKKYKINKPEKNYIVKIDSSVKQVRPFTACSIVKNLSFNIERIKEIIDLQEKLHSTIGRKRKKLAIGIYPLEKIKLPIKYLALHPEKISFIPLDFDKPLTAKQILQKHSAGKEYSYLLENLPIYPLFIDSNNQILSMPPIINSNETGKITESTTDLFIECSGHDFLTLKKTLNIIVTTLAEMGGKIYQMELNYGKTKELTPNLDAEKMKISLENTNSILGLNLKEKDLSRLLPKMGYNYNKSKVESPSWRTDILHEVDIIEDIAIAYGYNNLAPEVPTISTIAEESEKSKIKIKISEILIGLGLIEISSYHLVKADEAKKEKLENPLELENSKTEYKLLRPNLLISTLRIISENKDNEYPQRIFEIGTVFSQDKNQKSETEIKESTNLIIAITPANFTEIKKILDYLTKSISLEYELQELTHKNLVDGRTAKILINNKSFGYMGEIHPKTLHTWNIKMPLAILEISLEEVFNKFQQL